MGQKFRKISSYGNNANGGYFRQCHKLIRDQNQYHCSHTRYHPIGAATFSPLCLLSALSSHNDINLVTITFNGNGPLLESLFAFPFDQQNSIDCIKKMGLGFVVFFLFHSVHSD